MLSCVFSLFNMFRNIGLSPEPQTLYVCMCVCVFLKFIKQTKKQTNTKDQNKTEKLRPHLERGGKDNFVPSECLRKD